MEPKANAGSFDPLAITRPDPTLMRYYLVVSLFTLVAFPIVILPLFFKYETLRYRFDDKGVSMSWGILFRREIHLTYRRIQDIQVTRNLVQRWFGLASVGIQTASGSSSAEMVIDGILEAEALRDFLYTKMRGAAPDRTSRTAAITPPIATDSARPTDAATSDEALALLQEIHGLLQRVSGTEARS